MSAPPLAGLALFLAFFLAQRVFELWLSRRHAAALKARGGIEHARAHFPWLVALHVLFPVALLGEVLGLQARPPAAWPAWLALFAAAQALRWSAIHALGERWNVRIWTVPGEPPVRRGPYRLLRHPNYLAVAIELVAGPALFGAWRTAVLFSLLNLVAMAVRVPAEERALGLRATTASPAGAGRGRAGERSRA